MNVTCTFGHTVCFLIAWLRAGPEHGTAELHKGHEPNLRALLEDEQKAFEEPGGAPDLYLDAFDPLEPDVVLS